MLQIIPAQLFPLATDYYSQCQVFHQVALHHLVHVLDAVGPRAQAEMAGEGLVGVVGGVKQLVHRRQFGGADNCIIQPFGPVLCTQ